MKITVCIGSSCHIKGSRQVVEQLQYLVKTQEGEYLVNTDVTQRLKLHDRVTLFISPDKSILVSA